MIKVEPDITIYDSEYLRFVEIPKREGAKTRVIAVHAVRGDLLLGTIKWFGRWRQYTFWPEPETIFNRECLHHITGLITFLNAEPRKT